MKSDDDNLIRDSPAGDPVPFRLAPSEGDRAAFRREEITEALRVPGLTSDEASKAADEIYTMDSAGGIVFEEILLSAVGSLSDECAARVAAWLRESPQETTARLDRFEKELRQRRLLD